MFLHLTFISHFLSISSHVSYHFAYGIVSFVVKGRSDVNEVFILEIFILEPESIEFLKIIKLVLDEMRSRIHGMVHCSGGAQTKVLHFVGDNCRIIKNNMFPIPPLFMTIKKQSGTDWTEMYKVFNMGHRFEIYLSPEDAERVIEISKSFNVDAQIIGRVEEGTRKEVIVHNDYGVFRYK